MITLKAQTLTTLFFFFTLAGCKKSKEANTYTFNGLVLNWDTKAPIAGVKVYLGGSFFRPSDSAVTNTSGRVNFVFSEPIGIRYLWASDPAYINPMGSFLIPITNITSRTDTIYLIRPSYLQVNLHRVNTYNPTDSLAVRINGWLVFKTFTSYGFTDASFGWVARPALGADTTMMVAVPFFSAPGNKVAIERKITRQDGAILSSRTDSTE